MHPGAGFNANLTAQDSKAVADYAGAAKAQSIPDFILHIIPNTIVDAFTRGDILQVLLVAILFGFALSSMGPRCKHVVDLFDGMTHAVFGVVNIVMRLAPIGAFGAMAFTVGRYGITALGPLLKLIATFYATCLVFVFVILGLVCWAAGFNIIKYLLYIKEEILLTLATSSSEPALPTLMSKMENAGMLEVAGGLSRANRLHLQYRRKQHVYDAGGPIHRPSHQHTSDAGAATHHFHRGRPDFQRSKRCARRRVYRAGGDSDRDPHDSQWPEWLCFSESTDS